MHRLIFILSASTAAALAVPASAQTNTYPGEPGMQNRIDQLTERLEEGVDAGTITRAEARPLRTQLRELIRLEARYSANGLTSTERQELNRRIRQLRQSLNRADGRGRWNQWEEDDTTTQYAQVNELCLTQSGIGAILGRLLGSDNCLRVGERVSSTAGLQSVPTQYRAEFADRSDYVFRYLNGHIIEIDARTRLVNRIYVVNS